MHRLIVLTRLLLTLCSLSLLAQPTWPQSESPTGSDRPEIAPQVVPIGSTPRYLVGYMNSQTTPNFRSATAVSVTNQSPVSCSVTVEFFRGFSSTANCSASAVIAPGLSRSFCSRSMPSGTTTCDTLCSPQLTFNEGHARVSSTADAAGSCGNIGVDPRLFYFNGTTTDASLAGVTSLKVIRIGQGNSGN